MTKNSIRNNSHKKGLMIGRITLFVILILALCVDMFAQDYRISLNPRRLGNQLGVEVWVKTLNPAAAPLGDMTIPVQYNSAYLTGAPQGDRNQPSSKTDAVYNNADMTPEPLPYYIIESQFHNTNGFKDLYAAVAEASNEATVTLFTRLNNSGQGGFLPDDKDKGSFIGMLRLNIKNIALTDAATADFDFNSGNTLGNVVILDANGNDITAKAELEKCEPFTVRGITVLNPTNFQTVNRHPATPYPSMRQNYGYPIYFERSGLAIPSTTEGVYGTQRYAYKIEYSLDDGRNFTETGRVAESRLRNSAMAISPETQAANYNGMIDYLDGTMDYYITTGSVKPIPADVNSGLDLLDMPDGPGLDTAGYGGVLRVIWKGDPNFPYRSEKARLRITQLETVPANSNTNLSEPTRPTYTDATRKGTSKMSFVLGRIFFVQLNGKCQYLKSEKNFSTPSLFTVEAWINLNHDNGLGSQPGIIAASSGSAAQPGEDGGWMLYLEDGRYPAFRVRAEEGGYLGKVQAHKPLTVHSATTADGNILMDANHSRNWTHIAAVVASNVVTLYVDGEQVDQYINTTGAKARPLRAEMKIWAGVNPNNGFREDIDFLYAGIKEVKVWKHALSQAQLRQYLPGVPFPTRAVDTSKALGEVINDPKATLSIYANLQGTLSDLADNGTRQDFSNPLNYFIACNTSLGIQASNNLVYYRPDGSHIKITSPSCGEGVSNLKGKIYEIRWSSYGIGDLLASQNNGNGDLMVQVSRDGGNNWFDAIGQSKFDPLTGGTFALPLDNEKFVAGVAYWEPYNNVTLTNIANDLQGVLKIDNNYAKTVKIRVSGNEIIGQEDIYAESDEFLVAPHFALLNRPSTKVTIPGSQKLNVSTQNAFMEAWIKPYSFPVGNHENPHLRSYPIIVKKSADAVNEVDGLHYALRLEPTGQLSFSFATYDSVAKTRTIRKAYSDINMNLLKPNSVKTDSVWYHVGVYLNFPPNGTASSITFFIDGTAQTVDSIKRQLGSGIISETKNIFPTYLGYEPNGIEASSYFDGEIKEVRFWRNNPAGFNDRDYDESYPTTKKLYNFIQGAATVRANELAQVGTTNYAQGLIAAYSMDGGSWTNDGVEGSIAVYPPDPELKAKVYAFCGERKYTATKPLIKLVEPGPYQKVGNTDTLRVRWIGFDYNRNELVTFTTGTVQKESDLGISNGGGGGATNDKYPAVASVFENTAFRNAMTLPKQVNPFEFQGTIDRSQFAALLDMSVANSDVKRNKSFDEQGPVPSSQNDGRLQLFARANINSPEPLEYANGKEGKGEDGLIETLKSESARFSITPPSNFTVRLLLEGYHQGISKGIIGNMGRTFEENGLRIRFYQDNSNAPGDFVPGSITLNKSGYSITAKKVENRGKGSYDFANVPFTLTEALDKKYFVVVDHQNYLPVMSSYAAQFLYAGDDVKTWDIESGWDFQAWNGVKGNYMNPAQATTQPITTGNTFNAFMEEECSADRNTSTWTLTPLNYNDGHGARTITALSLPSMVGGDVIRDGLINSKDRDAISTNASMSYNAKYDLKGYGVPNAIERTIVDNNMGKISALRNIKSGAIHADIGYATKVEGGIVENASDQEIADAQNFNVNVNNIIAERQAKIQETFLNGIDYKVTAVPIVNGNYVDVAMYIENTGDLWAMANASFPIEYDPTVLNFNGMVQTENVIFNSNEPAGYLKAYYAPTNETIDPVANTYSIEINFNAQYKDNKPGITVPSKRTYLGSLRFNLLRNDESIFFKWSPYAAVLAVDGRNLTGEGTFDEIRPIIVNKTIELVSPNGGEKYDGGSTHAITWKSPLASTLVSLEYSSDNGKNWTLINHESIPVTLGYYLWNIPFINSDQCLARIVNTATKEVLATSKATFTIKIAPTEITRPSSADPTYVAGAKDFIKWTSVEPVNVYFEFSEDGIKGWTKVTDIVKASAGQVAWWVKAANTCKAVVRMINAETKAVMATSEPFKVGVGSMAFTNPKKGDKVAPSSKTAVKWTVSGITAFTIEMSTDAGAHWIAIAENVKATTRTYNWNVPNIESKEVILRAVNPNDKCLEYNRTEMFAIGAVSVEEPTMITGNAIASVSPNPVSDDATIKINLTENANVNIAIYDLHGAKIIDIVNNDVIAAGTHNIDFNASNLSSGVYVIRMQVNGTILVKEFVKVK